MGGGGSVSKQPSRHVDLNARLLEYRACLSRESNYPHWGDEACYTLKLALKWFDETFPEVKDGFASEGESEASS